MSFFFLCNIKEEMLRNIFSTPKWYVTSVDDFYGAFCVILELLSPITFVIQYEEEWQVYSTKFLPLCPTKERKS